MLGALEDRYLSRNCHRIAWKHDIEIERCAVHLAAGHTVADADAIRLPAALRTSPCRKRSRLYGLYLPCAMGTLNEPRLVDRGADEGGEQWMRLERSRFELRVELDADEPRMVRSLDDLRQQTVRRETGEAQAGGL